MDRRTFVKSAALTGALAASHSPLAALGVERSQAATPHLDREVDALLERMTLEEKVGQLSMSFHFDRSETFDRRVAAGQVGAISSEVDVAERNRLQHLAVDRSRLRIPLIFGTDVLHGFRIIFPVPLAMASSWDLEMIEEVQARAALEARLCGQSWTWSPMVDIARDPRWGRIVEGAGEDPYLGSKVAVAQVKGLQGTGPIDERHVAVTLKHFAGYGACVGGRDYDDVNLSESQLRNVYLPPFKAGVDAGARAVMSAYVDLNDVPASGNAWLLREVLRREWGFKGMVLSDNNAVSDLARHGFARDKEDAAIRALDAGVDVSMSNAGMDFTPLLSAARSGRLSLSRLDDAVRQVLRLKHELGLFEQPFVDPNALSEAVLRDNLEAARRAAVKSAVLLKNEGALLPLPPGKYPKLAVIGQLADSRQDAVGPWYSGFDIDRVTTIREALARCGQFRQVEYAQGVQLARLHPSPFDVLMEEKPQEPWTQAESDEQFSRAVEVARAADLIIAVMGELQDMSGEFASRACLDLPGRQRELLKSLCALGKPIVLVLVNGRPLTIPWEVEHIPAILEMWFPGSAGGDALVDLLFGKANPSGKLTTTWPRSADQIPMYYSHNQTQDPQDEWRRYWDAPSTPLFPFGCGLSYTRFSFSAVRALTPTVRLGHPVTIEAEVENVGSCAGDAVAQLYIHQRFGSDSRPIRELKGFARVTLQPRERKTARFVLSPEDLAYWSTAKQAWTQEASTFDFGVGEDSTVPLSGSFEVTR